jgi:hypothetical protein
VIKAVPENLTRKKILQGVPTISPWHCRPTKGIIPETSRVQTSETTGKNCIGSTLCWRCLVSKRKPPSKPTNYISTN